MHREYNRAASDSAAVAEHEYIPVAVRSIYDTALGNALVMKAHIVINDGMAGEFTLEGV